MRQLAIILARVLGAVLRWLLNEKDDELRRIVEDQWKNDTSRYVLGLLLLNDRALDSGMRRGMNSKLAKSGESPTPTSGSFNKVNIVDFPTEDTPTTKKDLRKWALGYDQGIALVDDKTLEDDFVDMFEEACRNDSVTVKCGGNCRAKNGAICHKNRFDATLQESQTIPDVFGLSQQRKKE